VKKIAPTLQRYCAWSPDKPGQANWSATEIRQVQAELRALLAVARAAKRLVYIDPDGDLAWNNDAGTLAHELGRALSRLDKVSHD
jgi:hypothetical protein